MHANQLSKVLNMSQDRKSTRLNSSHGSISYAVFCFHYNIFFLLSSFFFLFSSFLFLFSSFFVLLSSFFFLLSSFFFFFFNVPASSFFSLLPLLSLLLL